MKASLFTEAPPTIASEPHPKIVEAPGTHGEAGKENIESRHANRRPSFATGLRQVSSEPPKDLGKGGGQHKAIQQRIKKVAEDLGFRSIIEHPIAGSKEGIDLFLKRGTQEIACEISISTTIDHEVLNASKCLKAGIATVAMICLDEDRLRKIAAAVSGSLGPEVSAKVVYFKPDPFIEYLKSLPPPPPKSSEKDLRGIQSEALPSQALGRGTESQRRPCPQGAFRGAQKEKEVSYFRVKTNTGPVTLNGEYVSIIRTRSLVQAHPGFSSALKIVGGCHVQFPCCFQL